MVGKVYERGRLRWGDIIILKRENAGRDLVPCSFGSFPLRLRSNQVPGEFRGCISRRAILSPSTIQLDNPTHLPVLPLLNLVTQLIRSPQSLLLYLFPLSLVPTTLLTGRGRFARAGTALDGLSGQSSVLGRSLGERLGVGGLTLGLTGGESGELGLDGFAVRGVGRCGRGCVSRGDGGGC